MSEVALVVPASADLLASAAQDDFHLTDVGNAQRLVERHGRDLRYVHPWGSWLVWDGARWQRDESGEAERRAKETLRHLLAEANEIKDEKRRARTIRHVLESERSARIRAMLELGRSEPEVPVQPAELDRDPLLFNTYTVTIDLRSGQAREHWREDLITKVAPTGYDPAATAARFEAFLAEILPDAEVRAFLARLVGYALTGLRHEQVLPIFYGPGANGKTTLVELLLELFGEYGQHAPAEMFVERRDTIPNDIARLRGARVVIASELAEGRRLNEPLVKRMTGGDKMVARFMRGEWFEFEPTFTPILVTNHRPEIRGTDEAIWRRVLLVPFAVTIPPERRNPSLLDELKRELRGVLMWALRGCLDWQRQGLNPPDSVQYATATYRAEMDVLGDFLGDCCILGAEYEAKPTQLHAAFKQWAEANGERVLSAKALAGRLQERGYSQRRTGSARWWVGLGLLDSLRNEP